MPATARQKAPKGRSLSQTGTTITDPRFANIHTDPRFRLPSKKHTRVQLDKRFARVLKDEDFTRKASVDRYGRNIDRDQGRKGLEKFYRIEDEDQDDKADDDEEVRRELRRVEKKYDPAREGGFSTSEDESDTGESDEEEELDVEDATDIPEQAQESDIPMGEVSSRLAAVNLDWDNIRAVDLMAVASSFAPEDGRIENIAIYPSEFGRERIEREELEGPPRELFFKNKSEADDFESVTSDEEEAEERIKKRLLQEDKGEEYDSSALREYQLQRLRYYYAILTCSTPETAKALYDAMDGREYLSSANFFDLRFVPDGVSFDDDKPRDTCTRLPDGYRPNEFVTDALTHSKVRLTWDADDKTRKEVQRRAFSRAEIDENDIAAYVGSDTSEEEDENEEPSEEQAVSNSATSIKKDKAAALRAALGLSAEPTRSSRKNGADGPVGGMQITFSSGLSGAKGGPVFENEPIIEETTKEKYIRKEKERKARRKEKAKAARAATNGETVPQPASTNPQHHKADTKDADESIAGPKCLEEEEDDDPFNDPFFADPTGPASRVEEKKARRAEKARKRAEREAEEAAAAAQRAELELLMVDEKDSAVRHFDMAEIVKAEKARKKGRKKGKRGRGEGEEGRGGEREGRGAAGGGDGADAGGFAIDVEDPRFARLFESHEFAIDPTNPKFRGTEGMKALLEEGRKKRKVGRREDVEDGGEESRSSSKKVKARDTEDGDRSAAGGDNIKKLVERVKGKSKGRA